METLRSFDNWLEKQAIFPILDKLGKLSILVAILSTAISYQADRKNTIKARHFQAWQVINTATGQTGSGGRELAIRDLIKDDVPMAGINIENAWLQYADLSNGDFNNSNFKNTRISGVEFMKANFTYAKFTNSVLIDIDFSDAVLEGVDFTNTQMFRLNLSGANLNKAVLIGVKGLTCEQLKMAKNWEKAKRSTSFVCH